MDSLGWFKLMLSFKGLNSLASDQLKVKFV